MPVNVSAVMRDHIPFECLLSECLRTTIYRVPQFFSAADDAVSGVVLDADDFKAGITTNPEKYFSQNDLSGQFLGDPTFLPWVLEHCKSKPGTSVANIHLVLQVRQELDAWPATDGQCWKADLGCGEHLLFVDGGVHPLPPFDDKLHWRNAVLAAARIELDSPGSFENVADQVSYRTTDGRWLDLLRLGVSKAEASVSHPLTADKLRERVGAIELRANNLKARVDSDGADPAPLRRLLDALQLAPITDDAYRRLWFLQLHDRCRRFLYSIGRKIKEEPGFKNVDDHRDEIAHEGVERIDLRLMEELQRKAYDLITQNTLTSN